MFYRPKIVGKMAQALNSSTGPERAADQKVLRKNCVRNTTNKDLKYL